ncbi:hypothetical protein CDL12_06684 [Handroanthus impetiginosus]|uniref:Uncharacterized protein n=1 Tax=Handroanthus impetiginosus TaxID=429701 RepID=A0A2G9HSW4_9LAMI|nr:hypothetical protein CDL12_06684 [Handroanthus impetiginosus]
MNEEKNSSPESTIADGWEFIWKRNHEITVQVPENNQERGNSSRFRLTLLARALLV